MGTAVADVGTGIEKGWSGKAEGAEGRERWVERERERGQQYLVMTSSDKT